MTVHLRSSRFSVPAFAILVGGLLGLLIVPATATSRPECQLARDWVQANKGRLPTTLSDFAAFPRSFRLQIFQALPKEAKASLWRARYTQLLARPLTPGQRALLQEAIPMLTPELYAMNGRGRMPAQWTARAKVEFTRGNGLEWITDLADTSGSYDVLPPAMRPAGLGKEGGAVRPECTCAVSEDNTCEEGYKCCGYNPPCDTPIGIGCGLSGLNFCDGMCQLPSHPTCR